MLHKQNLRVLHIGQLSVHVNNIYFGVIRVMCGVGVGVKKVEMAIITDGEIHFK